MCWVQTFILKNKWLDHIGQLTQIKRLKGLLKIQIIKTDFLNICHIFWEDYLMGKDTPFITIREELQKEAVREEWKN